MAQIFEKEKDIKTLHITISRWELTVLRTFILHIAHICKEKKRKAVYIIKVYAIKGDSAYDSHRYHSHIWVRFK